MAYPGIKKTPSSLSTVPRMKVASPRPPPGTLILVYRYRISNIVQVGTIWLFANIKERSILSLVFYPVVESFHEELLINILCRSCIWLNATFGIDRYLQSESKRRYTSGEEYVAAPAGDLPCMVVFPSMAGTSRRETMVGGKLQVWLISHVVCKTIFTLDAFGGDVSPQKSLIDAYFEVQLVCTPTTYHSGRRERAAIPTHQPNLLPSVCSHDHHSFSFREISFTMIHNRPLQAYQHYIILPSPSSLEHRVGRNAEPLRFCVSQQIVTVASLAKWFLWR